MRLSRNEAREALHLMTSESADPVQTAAFLTVYNMRPVSIGELLGFRDALMELRTPVDLGEQPAIDLCGTGGDGKNTFNISTLSSMVAAAAGARVAKHGNRSVSSHCGSSNVLEHLGVRFSADPVALRNSLDTHGICFLHAPLFHPAMKVVAPVRSALGVKTFFNMLGPLVNPADPAVQTAGVFNAEVARLYFNVFQELGKRFAVVYDLHGYDEISLTGPVKIWGAEGERILKPQDFGLNTCRMEELHGGKDVEEAAGIFMAVLEGRDTGPRREAVCANAGLALSVYFEIPLKQGVERAAEALDSRSAAERFHQIVDQ